MTRHFAVSLSLVLVGLACTSLCVPSTLDAAKVDKPALAKIWVDVDANLKNPKAKLEFQVDAVKKLNGLLDYEIALKLLAYFGDCDNAYKPPEKGKPASNRPKEAYKIATAILAAVASMTDGDEALMFKDLISAREKWPLRVRTAMIDAMCNCAADHKGCFDLLVDQARNAKDTDARVLITLGLKAQVKVQGVRDLMFELLGDRSWRVRDAATDAMVEVAAIDRDKAIVALIVRLAAEDGKLRENIADALYKITGQKLGAKSDAWCDWWKSMGKPEAGLPAHGGGGDHSTGTRMFGTETFSNRLIFLIDSSISMTEKISPDEKERMKRTFTKGPGDDPNEPDRLPDGRRALDWDKINCKLDLAREEMIRSLEVMDPKKTSFTIISFSESATFWKQEMMPCTETNRKDAETWLRALKGKNKTNIFEGLEKAFDFSEKLAGIDPKKGGGGKVITGPHPDEVIPDTIFLYSDGFATDGKYCGDSNGPKAMGEAKYAVIYAGIMREMIDEITSRNRIERIQINTVGVGRQDKRNMGELARENRGTYIAIGLP